MRKYRVMRFMVYGGIGVLFLMVMRHPERFNEKPLTDVMPTVKLRPATVDHLDQRSWDNALDDLIPLLEKKGSDPNLRYYIAWCFKELGSDAFQDHRYEEAVVLFEDGIYYDENDADLYLALGMTHFIRTDYENAERAFQKVLDLDPENTATYKQLGELYYLQNKLYEAETAWSMSYTLDSTDVAVEKRLSELRQQIHLRETLDTDESIYFSVTYDGAAMPQLEYVVLEILEAAYYDIGAKLQAYPKRQISVTLLAKEDFFDITGSPDWASGLYEGQIKIPVQGADRQQLKKVLYHEYVHAVLFDRIGPSCPWWFNEGLAQYLSDRVAEETAPNIAVSDDVEQVGNTMLSELGGVLNLDENTASKAYRSALTGVQYLTRSYGEANLQRIIRLMADGNSFDTAFWIATGHSFDQFEKEWKSHFRRQ